MDLKILKVQVTDFRPLTALARQTFVAAFAAQNTEADMQLHLSSHMTEAKLLDELQNPQSQFWWVLEHEKPIAFCKLNFAGAQSEINDPESLEIERIYTLAEWQGKGLGQMMLAHAEHIANQHGLRYTWLGVWEHNTRAIKFYQRHGYVKFNTHHFLLGTDLQTDWLMRKEL